MNQFFFNKAQIEKFEVLQYSLSSDKNDTDTLYYSKKLGIDRHRLRSLNKDLFDCSLALKIESDLSYHYTSNQVDGGMVAYHNKKTVMCYYYYLLKQSNLFHFISYLVKKEKATIEDTASDLNLSNSYIYKLIAQFNNLSEPIYGVTVKVIKKNITFSGSEDKLIVALFDFYALIPETKKGDYTTTREKSDSFLKALRLPLLQLFEKSESTSDAELLYELYQSFDQKNRNYNTIEEQGYDLVRIDQSVVNVLVRLIKYYSNSYPQVKLQDASFYVPELIKVITLLKVNTMAWKKLATKDITYQNEDVAEVMYIERVLLEEGLFIDRKIIKMMNHFIKRFLKHSTRLKSCKVYINLVESLLLTRLYRESIGQYFNSDTVMLVEDIELADIIITNDYTEMMSHEEGKVIYAIQKTLEEFEKKDYLHFIMNIVKNNQA